MVRDWYVVCLIAIAAVFFGCASLGINHSPEVLEKGETEFGIGMSDAFSRSCYVYYRFGIFPRVDSCIRLVTNMAFFAGRIDVDFSLSRKLPLVTMIASASLEGGIDLGTWYELSGTLLVGSDRLFAGAQVIHMGGAITSDDWGIRESDYIGVLLGGALGGEKVRLQSEIGVLTPLRVQMDLISLYPHIGCGFTFRRASKTSQIRR